MIITESRWSAFFRFRFPRQLSITAQTLFFGSNNIPLNSVQALTSRPCVFPLSLLGYYELGLWSSHSRVSVIAHRSVIEEGAQILLDLTRRLLRERLNNCKNQLELMEQQTNQVFQFDHYIRASQVERLKSVISHSLQDLRTELSALSHCLMLSEELKVTLSQLDVRFGALSICIEPGYRQEHNNRFIERSMQTEHDFFGSIESQPLTYDQRLAALVFEDSNLTVAAAGSGKSSCIVAKIGFALKTNRYRDDEILALAFNKDAANQLSVRIKKRLIQQLGRNVAVSSKTFHAFGLATLLSHYGESCRPKVLKENGKEEGRFIKTVIANLHDNDPDFQHDLAMWMLACPMEEPQPVGYSDDLDECERLYERACREALQAKPKKGGDWFKGSVPTFDSELYVRSLQERAITNWLLLRGVEFEYEKPDYEGGKLLGLRSKNDKQVPYKPDFTYSGWIERLGELTQYRVVHEHFALDKSGNAPEWLGGAKYARYARQKRAMFVERAANNATAKEPIVLIETHSAHFQDGSVFTRLESDLQRWGVKLNEPRRDILESALHSFRQYSELERLLVQFVLSFKDSGLTKDEVRIRSRRSLNPYRAELFLNVAFRIFDGYQSELERHNKIDYADMLREAIGLLRSGVVKTPYKFVLVDEFQDISRLRAQLVKSIVDQNPEDSIVFCVGDDWQTINRFAGSDVEVFKNTGTFFKREVASVYLSKTFRCPQGIADIAKAIVMSNEGQLDKDVDAANSMTTGTVRIVEHGPEATDRRMALEDQLNWIVGQHKEDKKPEIYILRRTEAETTSPEGLDDHYLKLIEERFSDSLEIKRMSIHGSKGLEADYVILPGLDSGFRGFPDERQPEWLLDLVLPDLNDPLQEERRLFYVGLTRAKKVAIVLTNAVQPSEFVQQLQSLNNAGGAIEWIASKNHQRVSCPRCKKGSLVPLPNTTVRVCSRRYPCGYRCT